jgi:hypothetical protein
MKAIKKLKIVPAASAASGDSPLPADGAAAADAGVWSSLRVKRYRPISSVDHLTMDYNPSSLSVLGDGDDDSSDRVTPEQFDSFSLRAVLKDYLHADPATRYDVAKNAFEQALSDARVSHSVQYEPHNSMYESTVYHAVL